MYNKCVGCRIQMCNSLDNTLIFLTSLTLNIIFNGDEIIDTHANIELHEAVSKYITQTNRF